MLVNNINLIYLTNINIHIYIHQIIKYIRPKNILVKLNENLIINIPNNYLEIKDNQDLKYKFYSS
jgi:hypothetical protein